MNILSLVKNSSAFLPALFSFLFNFMIASIGDTQSYSQYILLISWATFLGTLSSWSFVDLSISGTFQNSEPLKNLALSLLSSLFVCFLFAAILVYSNFFSSFIKSNTILTCGFAVAFSWTRSFSLFWANSKNITALVQSRLLRALALFLLGASLLFFRIEDYRFAIFFQILAFLVGLGLVGKHLKAMANSQIFSHFSSSVLRVSTVRTLSLAVDMVHLPLCLMAMNSFVTKHPVSSDLKIFVIGLGLPAIAIISQILNEYFRGRLSLSGTKKHNKSRLVGISSLVALIISAWICVLVYEKAFYLVLVIFVFGKLLSSFVGLIVYKLNFEKYDLAVNVASTIAMLLLMNTSLFGSWHLVNLILTIIATKYLLITLMVGLTKSKVCI